MNSNENINKPSFSYRKVIIAAITFCILLYLIYKYYIKQYLEQMAPITKKLLNYLDNDDTNNNNTNNTNNNSTNSNSYSLNINNFPSYNTFSSNTPQETTSIPRFANDYCRTSPNITYTSNNNINKHTFSLTNTKHTFTCNFERIDSLTSTKQTINSIMTVIPYNTSNIIIDINSNNISKTYTQFILSLSKTFNKHIVEYLHFVFLNKQKILIKITPLYKQSLHSLIQTQSKKKFTQLQVIDYAWQLINMIFILHNHGIFHLHIHSENILINEDNVLLLNDIENALFSNFKHKRQEFLEYIYQYYNWKRKEKDSFMFADDHKNKISLYEVIDIVSYGSVLYEMIMGDTMKTHKLSADDLNTLGYFNYDIEQLMRKIFPLNGICSITAKEICMMNMFKKYNSNFNKNCDINNKISDNYNNIIKLIYNEDLLLNNQTYI